MATVKLGQIDREKRPEPFSLELTNGDEVFFADPKRMHFTVLTTLDDLSPADQIKTLAGEDGFEKLSGEPEMDGEAMEWVMGQWRDHYGMGDSGEPGSSSGS